MGQNHQDLVSSLWGFYPSLRCPFWAAVVGLCTQTQSSVVLVVVVPVPHHGRLWQENHGSNDGFLIAI